MKRWALTLFIALSLSWIACVRTDGFSTSLIEGALFTEAAPPVSFEVREILSQRYRYLNKGRQCFVFESADGKYVLKFFNQKYLQLPWYTFVKTNEKAKRALRRLFYENSYGIAYRELGEEILYLHLGPSDRLPEVSLVDKASGEHVLDLNQFPFVLQRKGIPLYLGLESVYEKKGLEGLCREIDSFIGAISLRISKSIADADHDVKNNWGYSDGHLFHLDPGRLYYDDRLSDPIRCKKEWHVATHGLHKWLKMHYPEAAKYLENQLPAN